ncbi:MAG: hypothetical protein IPO41_16675 [Acidobacteria bacterium]|nr:hypothetical protein [Acidobacteriota bacterium]
MSLAATRCRTPYLTIEYDNIVPEEDWTAGLPVVLRGIQNNARADIALGIVISLEQVRKLPQTIRPRRLTRQKTEAIGPKGIAGAEEKVTDKWMPADLMNIAEAG